MLGICCRTCGLCSGAVVEVNIILCEFFFGFEYGINVRVEQLINKFKLMNKI